jgi:hypothetical protein
MKLINLNALAIRFASMRLREKENVVMAAVKQDSSSLKYVPEALRDNHNIAKAAVQKDGNALQ